MGPGAHFRSALLLAFGGAMLISLMATRSTGWSELDDPLAIIRAFAFFWVIVPAVAGLLIWIGVLSAGFSDEPVPAPTT